MSTAPPKASWQPGCHRNLQAQTSEYHDKDLFKQMARVHVNIQQAKKWLGEEKRRQEKRREAGKTPCSREGDSKKSLGGQGDSGGGDRLHRESCNPPRGQARLSTAALPLRFKLDYAVKSVRTCG